MTSLRQILCCYTCNRHILILKQTGGIAAALWNACVIESYKLNKVPFTDTNLTRSVSSCVHNVPCQFFFSSLIMKPIHEWCTGYIHPGKKLVRFLTEWQSNFLHYLLYNLLLSLQGHPSVSYCASFAFVKYISAYQGKYFEFFFKFWWTTLSGLNHIWDVIFSGSNISSALIKDRVSSV